MLLTTDRVEFQLRSISMGDVVKQARARTSDLGVRIQRSTSVCQQFLQWPMAIAICGITSYSFLTTFFYARMVTKYITFFVGVFLVYFVHRAAGPASANLIGTAPVAKDRRRNSLETFFSAYFC